MNNIYDVYAKRVTAKQLKSWLDHFADEVSNHKWVKMPYVDWRYLQAELKRADDFDNFKIIALVNDNLDGPTLIVPPGAISDDQCIIIDNTDGSFGAYLWQNVPLMRNDYIDEVDYKIAYHNLPSAYDSLRRSYQTYLLSVPDNQLNYYTKNENNNNAIINPENILKNEKENKNMFNFDFGPCGDTVRLSMYGIAVKNVNGNYVSYDKKNDEIIDVDILNFEGGKYCYKIPVSIDSIVVGDTIIHAKKPMFVVGKNDSNLVVVDVVAGEEKSIIPTRNMFGFDYATKVVSVIDSFGGLSANKDNPFGNMLPLLLLGDNKSGNISDMLLPLMLMGGNGAVDFTKNPMMLYLLMNDKSKSIDPLMLMALTGNLNFGANPQTPKK